MQLTEDIRQKVLIFQRTEITEYHIYSRLAKKIGSPENAKIIQQIADDELRHYHGWRKYSGQEIPPDRFKVWFYYFVSLVFGFTFGVKLMEGGEAAAQKKYAEIAGVIPEAAQFQHEENIHEEQLIGMLDEERLRYAGSVVLGLNDALVELTGALAGLTLALQNGKLIALSGLITGIAASLSMAASEYLSTRSEKTDKQPVRAAVYTGIAYIITVTLLVLPYLIMPKNFYVDLIIALTTSVIIIAVFNYYISVAKGESFRARFVEMAGLSLSVAAFSFIIGYFIRMWLGIEV
ncbi:MAG: rubrerythrin family protein [Anaerolineae bacterium CG_4_9_14_3_um_filter_57_17]|nr:rubrerythrin family protein [bacterium]NCT20315.1 rubrerythrin family protein [bacterium]OIO84794.1 MAG: rubrerythrin family protein [Anaerolineae bacterium CG2_30_57_67]PJB64762.1 MAG: rubrerythrin family protein [Anaerolineae bacterium CG_4_9_14_3_um_filter_57_17]